MFILLQKNYYEYMIKYHLTGNKSIVMISFIWSHLNINAFAKSLFRVFARSEVTKQSALISVSRPF